MFLLGFFLNKTSSLRSLEDSLNHDYPILLQIARQVPEHLAQIGSEHQVQAEGWQLSGRCVCRCEPFPEPPQGGRCLVDQADSSKPIPVIRARASSGGRRKLISGPRAHGTGKWIDATGPAMISCSAR